MTVNHLTPKTKFILIACDGIWDCLESELAVKFIDERLEQAIQKNKEFCTPIRPSELLAAMFDNIISPNLEIYSNGSDNMSACLLIFKQNDE